MSNQPLVSVFIPYYNDEKFLKTAIDAVLAQTYTNFELVLLNHATTDSCREIAHSYTDPRIRHIDMPFNLGGGSGVLMAEFLKTAQGKYVKFLCADDILRKTGLADLVQYMEAHPNIDFAFGNAAYVNQDGKSLNADWFSSREYFSTQNSEVDCIRLYAEGQSFLPYVSNIVKREILSHIRLNKTFIMMFDMSLWLSLLCKGYKIGYCDRIVVDYRIHDEQVSALTKKDISSQLCFFEWPLFWETLLTIDHIELCQRIWPNDPYVRRLENVEDIPFAVAHALFDQLRPYPYVFISKLLHDEQQRLHLEKVFGYGIKELRDDCRKDYSGIKKKKKISRFKSYKTHIYSSSAKNLGLGALAFLMLRRLGQILTFSELRKPRPKKKFSL